jgi:hypothetical protein
MLIVTPKQWDAVGQRPVHCKDRGAEPALRLSLCIPQRTESGYAIACVAGVTTITRRGELRSEARGTEEMRSRGSCWACVIRLGKDVHKTIGLSAFPSAVE